MFINAFSKTVLGMSEYVINNTSLMKSISLPMIAEYYFIKYAEYMNPKSVITVPQSKNNIGHDFMVDNVCHEVKTYIGYVPKDRPNATILNISKLTNKKGSFLNCIFDIPGNDISYIAYNIPPNVWERSVNNEGSICMRVRYINDNLTLIHNKNQELLSYFNVITEQQIEHHLKEIHK